MSAKIFDPHRIDRAAEGPGRSPSPVPVERFERQFAEFIGRRYCRLTAGGGAALKVALGALRPKKVALTDVTHPSLLEAVRHAGARPVLLDVDLRTLNVSKKALAAARGSYDLFLCAHMFSTPGLPGAPGSVVGRGRPPMVEDASQIVGAGRGGRRYGSFGLIGVFSLSPYKPVSAPWTKAGAVVWDDPGLSDRIEQGLRLFPVPDARTAGYLSMKLERLPETLAGLRKTNRFYRKALSGLPGLSLPRVADAAQEFPVLTERRAELERHLSAAGVPLEYVYTPLHGRRASPGLPAASEYLRRALHLPVYPGMTEAEASYVAGAVRKFFGR